MPKPALLVASLVTASLALAGTVATPLPQLPVGNGPYTLVSSDSTVQSLVDRDGVIVKSWSVGRLVTDKELLPNGNLLLTGAGYQGIVGEVLKAPLEWPYEDVVHSPIGSTIYEIDWDGNVLWSLDHAGGVVLTWTHDTDWIEATDTFLIADTTSTSQFLDRVVEVDRAGNIVWAWYPPEGSYPNDADRLTNGNTLVSLRNLDMAVEVDPAGNIVWSYGHPGGPMRGIHNPDRLLDGNTIIADSLNNRIVEVTPGGVEVWTYGGNGVLNWPRDADVLPNGNVLITDSFNLRVIEVTRAGDVVWEWTGVGPGSNYDVDRLNEPPVVTVASPPEGAVVASPVAFDVAATDPSLAGAAWRLYDETAGAWVDGTWKPLPAGPWSLPLDSGHAYRLEVAAWDSGGEGGGWPQDDSVPEATLREVPFTVA